MREILFRGKSVNDGEWVFGSLVITTLEPVDDAPIKHYHIEDMTIGCFPNEFQSGLSETIDPNTVGQFTGLTDKNGKKIFEADIIRTSNGRISAVSVVKYGNFRPKMIYDMFGRYIGHFPKQDLHGVYCESSKEQMMLFDSPTCIEVIGNIHDNPELLEVE